jgi:predicted nucleic acid-binding Zn ribbon protein
MAMDILRQVLDQILGNNPAYQGKQKEFELLQLWPKVVGERVAKHVWPVKLLPDGNLLVASQSSSWLHQLRYLEPQIVKKFAAETKSQKIKGLRFKIASNEK